MGLHIIPYLLGEREVDEYGGKWLKTERFEGFDSTRYVGDSSFVLSKDFEWDEVWDDPDREWCDRSYIRPKDLDRAVEWVDGHMMVGNRHRLLGLLEAMRINSNLYLFLSW